METTPVAHTEPVPPTGLRLIWKHLTDWATSYFWVPLSFFLIWAFSKGAYLVSGREPAENTDWIVGIAGKLLVSICIILVLEILRQQTGKWWTADDLRKYPHLAWTQCIGKCVAIVALVYLFAH